VQEEKQRAGREDEKESASDQVRDIPGGRLETRVRGNFHVAYRGWGLPPKKSGTCRRQRFFSVRNITEMRDLNNKKGIFCLNISVFLENKFPKSWENSPKKQTLGH
jgi:hypothetical protein